MISPDAPVADPIAGLPEPEGSETEERIAVATQWQLMSMRFRKHRLAMASLIIVILFYLIAIFANFLAYADPFKTEAYRSLMPPQKVILWDDDGFNPHVLAVEGARDPVSFKRIYKTDPDHKIPLRLFAHGYEYKFLGLFRTDRHLIGVADDAGVTAEESIFLMGTDLLGRDLFSRLMRATRISLSVGLVGVALSMFLGVLLGGISGLYGGVIDITIQRLIEITRSIPTIPLWMGLAAAMPRDWSVVKIYFAITLIISLIGWTDLARVVRGRFLSLRNEDFVLAAELAGAGQLRIIFRHMVPSFLSHIIAAMTLALPAMIISETALSFLGLGLRPPAISWGVLLQDAQNIQTMANTPWLLLVAVPVIIVILAFNFLGDGLRDAADPYG
ncbi:MAG: ABC transporter permease [Anaerolineae bacterium]|nr:ABC transporter permease [Anaerolineae bacterium]